MSLDPYQPCPCGSNKKIKFCCCKDIPAELEKALRLIDGEQRIAALDHLNRVIQAKGERAALLLLKATVELQMGEMEKAETTVHKLVEIEPDNASAQSLSAILEAAKGNTTAAIQNLQRAIAVAQEEWPIVLVDAIDLTARTLLTMGDILPARGHLLLLADVGPDELRARALEMLMRIGSSTDVPLLLKQELSLETPPADAPWREPFEEAMRDAAYGLWQPSIDAFEDLARQYPDVAAIKKCKAYVRGWLGDRAATSAAWRQYAAIESLPLDDRIEAEAMAQTVQPETESESVNEVEVVYTIDDMDAWMERLLSSRQLAQMHFDTREFAQEGEPPPKAVFVLLDRDRPESADNMSADDLPRVLGSLFVHGRQTDRAARLELNPADPDTLGAAKAQLARVLGDLAGEPQDEVVGQVPKLPSSAQSVWMPPDATLEQRRRFDRELFRQDTLEQFPQRPLDTLGGKTLAQAASDPECRIPALAAILLHELANERLNTSSQPFDYNELRERLGLPRSEPIEPGEDFDARKLPLARIRRVRVEQLNDDDLVVLYQRATRVADLTAVRRLGEEAVRRDSLDDNEQIDKITIYRMLAGLSMQDPERAKQYLSEGRQYAVKRGRSPVDFLLTELPLAMSQGDVQRFQNLVTEIQTRHINEPGVGQKLLTTLAQMGLVRPDGTPVRPAGQAPPPEAAPAAENKIWTPEGSAAAGASGEKPKLWMPGMD